MIPDRKECMRILHEQKVPENIVKHTLQVTEYALRLAKRLIKEGHEINLALVEAAGLLHDVARAKSGDHVMKGTNFLKHNEMHEVAAVIRTHGLYHLPHIKPTTIEQKIIFYSDKRVLDDKLVTVKERFADLSRRYPDTDIETRAMEYQIVKKIEKELI